MRTTGHSSRSSVQPLSVVWTRDPAQVRPLVLLAQRAFIVVAFLYFVLSPGMLYLVGWNYLGGGTELEKTHLATYLLVCVFAFLFLSDLRFQSRSIEVILEPSFFVFALVSGIVALYAIILKQVSISPFVDTFFAAFMVTVGLIILPPRNLLFLRRLIDIFFVVNIVILFYEYFFATRILPSPTGGDAFDQINRAAALFEGSLSAATLLGVYSLVNLIATPIRFSAHCVVRLTLSFAAFAAIATTGGRTAFIAYAIIVPIYLLVSLIGQAKVGRLNGAALIYLLIGGPVFLFALIVLAQYGVFDTILARFDDDIGSAFSRQIALDLVWNMPSEDFWTGSSLRELAAIETLGLIAIEISWVNFVLVCGFPLAVAIFVTFLLFLFKFLPKACDTTVIFPAVFLLLNVSASNGIWSKTTILTTSVAIFLAFLRKDLTPA